MYREIVVSVLHVIVFFREIEFLIVPAPVEEHLLQRVVVSSS